MSASKARKVVRSPYPREDFGIVAELILQAVKSFIRREEVTSPAGVEEFLDEVAIFDLEAKDGGPYRFFYCFLASWRHR